MCVSAGRYGCIVCNDICNIILLEVAKYLVGADHAPSVKSLIEKGAVLKHGLIRKSWIRPDFHVRTCPNLDLAWPEPKPEQAHTCNAERHSKTFPQAATKLVDSFGSLGKLRSKWTAACQTSGCKCKVG